MIIRNPAGALMDFGVCVELNQNPLKQGVNCALFDLVGVCLD